MTRADGLFDASTSGVSPIGPYEIHCAEIWGGASAREDEIVTPGVRAAIHSSASGASKGGDLYYLSVCAWDRLTRLAIADVRGHGEAASQISEWLYGSLATRMNEADGAGVLCDLNKIVLTRGFQAITTAVVATFDRDRGTLAYTYAGHPPLLLGRPGEPWRELSNSTSDRAANLPLGVLPQARYIQETIAVAPGDRLFAYTDGVSECPAPESSGDPELYGDAKMLEALNRATGQPLVEIRRQLRDDLVRHGGASLEHDDCTFLLLEVLQPPPFWKRRILPGRARASMGV